MAVTNIGQLGITQAAKEYLDAIAWLERRGISTVRGRLNEYRRNCERWLNSTALTPPEVLSIKHFVEMRRVVEVHQQADALEALGDLQKRLKWVAKGNASHRDDLNHSPRNYLFELFAALWIHRVGLKLMPSVDGDVAAELRGRRFLFECKRPSSPQALASDVDEAFKQIERRRSQTHGRVVGMALIDFTLLLNPEDHSALIENPDDVQTQLAGLVDGLKERLAVELTRYMRSRDDAFVGIYFSHSAFVLPAMHWCFADRWLTLGTGECSSMASMWREAFGHAASDAVRNLSYAPAGE